MNATKQKQNKFSKQHFSFRESAKIEKQINAFQSVRSQSEFFTMRTILDAAKRTKSVRVNLQMSKLADKLFSHMVSRKLWREFLFNHRAWLNGFPTNYDQQDLMLACRRVARRIYLRRLGS